MWTDPWVLELLLLKPQLYTVGCQRPQVTQLPLAVYPHGLGGKGAQAEDLELLPRDIFKSTQRVLLGVQLKHLPFPPRSPGETSSPASSLAAPIPPSIFRPGFGFMDSHVYNSCKTGYSGACYLC